jgi:thymidylate synthase
MTNTIADIRQEFASKLENNETAGNTVEILGASFVADESTIFGTVNEDYLRRELAWYLSGSTKVEDLGEPVPEIWKNIASTNGEINSNYGKLLLSDGQYVEVIKTLGTNKDSRRAVAIYTKPSMHEDWSKDGMKDFVCTNVVHYEIRDNKLHVVVQMRSNDAVFGYKNDYAWQRYIQMLMVTDLMRLYPQLEPGTITWQVASLHVYSRHFYLIDHFSQTGETTVPKELYEGSFNG